MGQFGKKVSKAVLAEGGSLFVVVVPQKNVLEQLVLFLFPISSLPIYFLLSYQKNSWIIFCFGSNTIYTFMVF